MFVQLDRNGGIPIRKQLYDVITGKILSGELACGDRLPSTRELAGALGIARNTVVEIYEQLVSESYLSAASGKGTFVEERRAGLPATKAEHRGTYPVADSAQDAVVGETKCPAPVKGCITFASGVPDLGAFPRKAWLKALKESLDMADSGLFGYGDGMGYGPLRTSLAGHLAKHKGIRCQPGQIVIVNGTSDAMLLCALLFRDTKRELLVESAVIDFVPDIFRALDYTLVPLEVDSDGICAGRLPDRQDCLLFCSPSHQFPYGGALSIDRRLRLAAYARDNRHLLIEDDYCSEFRYAGAQVNSLYQLAPDHVIHLGTFSKTLAPFLRLGYMVLPEGLVPEVTGLQTALSRRVNLLDQMALDFLITQCVYARHVMNMGKRYKRKVQCLVSALQAAFGEEVRIHGARSGLHVTVTFPTPLFDTHSLEVLTLHGVSAERLVEYAFCADPAAATDTLVLGFGNLDEEMIVEGVRRLEAAVRQLGKDGAA